MVGEPVVAVPVTLAPLGRLTALGGTTVVGATVVVVGVAVEGEITIPVVPGVPGVAGCVVVG